MVMAKTPHFPPASEKEYYKTRLVIVHNFRIVRILFGHYCHTYHWTPRVFVITRYSESVKIRSHFIILKKEKKKEEKEVRILDSRIKQTTRRVDNILAKLSWLMDWILTEIQ